MTPPIPEPTASDDPTPVGRLAPSPTGLLHVGHARTFLMAWCHARARGGKVILRIEDLDAPRVLPDMIDAARRDLEWLGLDWDGPALLQSEGSERFSRAVNALAQAGHLYPCVCSRADIRLAQSAPQAGVVETRYPGTCRDRYRDTAEAFAKTGRPAGLRFRVPAGTVSIIDGFSGRFDCDPGRDVGDFLVTRRDDSPAYQLAVVVDDAHQGITEVVRGDDLLPSAARQFLLQKALGFPHPAWLHVPLVHDEFGQRLAKRTNALSLQALRAEGLDPRTLVAWLASTLRLSVSERITPRELLPVFSLASAPRSPVRFTPETLRLLAEKNATAEHG